MAVSTADITAASQGDQAALRRVLESLSSGVNAAHSELGIGSTQVGQSDKQVLPPRPASLTFGGANDTTVVSVVPELPDQDYRAGQFRQNEPEFGFNGSNEYRRNRKAPLFRQNDGRRNYGLIHQLQSATDQNFTANVKSYGPSPQTVWTITDSPVPTYWRVRSRFTDSDWNDWSFFNFSSLSTSLTTLNLDQINNGATYARPLATRISAGKPLIDFSEAIHVNKNLDNVPDGTRAAWDSGTQKTAAVDSSGNLLLKNVVSGSPSTFAPSISLVYGNATTYSVIPEMTKTITTKGNKVLISFVGSFTAYSIASGYSPEGIFYIYRDGSALGSGLIMDMNGSTANLYFPVTLLFLDSPSAGSHTYDIRWGLGYNSGVAGTTYFLAAGGVIRYFQVVEQG